MLLTVLGLAGVLLGWGRPPVVSVSAATSPEPGLAGAASPGGGAGASPSASPSTAVPSPTPAALATPAGTTTPEPVASLDPAEAVAAFFAGFVRALADGDSAWLRDRLHPAVVERYGGTQCADYLVAVAGTPVDLEVVAVGAAAMWDWRTDGRSIAVDGARTVDLVRTTGAGSDEVEAHVVVAGDAVTWFTDCGEPAP